MSATDRRWGPPCPVCGRPTGDIGPGQCPTCGLPAAAQAALVVARIGATLTDIARDRDELVATSARRAGTGRPRRRRPPPSCPGAAAATHRHQPAAAGARPRAPAQSRSRCSSGSARCSWSRRPSLSSPWPGPGSVVVFQARRDARRHRAAVRSVGVDGAQGPAGHRGGAAPPPVPPCSPSTSARPAPSGLFRLEDVGLRPWWAISCAIVVLVAVGLGRLTRTTAAWPLVALLAAQPLPFLLLADLADRSCGRRGRARGRRGRRRRRPFPASGVRDRWRRSSPASRGSSGPSAAWPRRPLRSGRSWTATGVLAVAGAGAAGAGPVGAPRPFARVVPAVGRWSGWPGRFAAHGRYPGPWIAVGSRPRAAHRRRPGCGPAAVAVRRSSPPARPWSACTRSLMADDRRFGALALVAAPRRGAGDRGRAAAAGSLRRPGHGRGAAAPRARRSCCPGRCAADGDRRRACSSPSSPRWRSPWPRSGRGTPRNGWPPGSAPSGLTAGLRSGDVRAWGQVGHPAGDRGSRRGGLRRRRPPPGSVSRRRPSWSRLVDRDRRRRDRHPEAYPGPAALGLLLIAVPALRAGARSWAAEGAALGVALCRRPWS